MPGLVLRWWEPVSFTTVLYLSIFLAFISFRSSYLTSRYLLWWSEVIEHEKIRWLLASSHLCFCFYC